MKILYLVTLADNGGAQKYVLALAKHFGGAIAAGTESDDLFKTARACGLKTYPLPHLKRDISPIDDCIAVWEIYRLIRNFKPDIVHLNSTKAGFLGSLAGGLVKIFSAIRHRSSLPPKIVFTAHGFRFHEPLTNTEVHLYKLAERLASPFRNRIITISQREQDAAIAAGIGKASMFTTIYNGIAPIDFSTKMQARQILGMHPEIFAFGTIANGYPTKGLDVLIQAVAMLPERLKKTCVFVIIGDGPQMPSLQLEIEKHRLQNIVTMAGKITGASKYLRAFDCFILPSRKEGLPYTILEALSAGLPVIATDVGGNREAVGDAGILVRPEQKQELADAIADMYDNPGARAAFGEQASARAKLFTETEMLAQTERVYKLLLQ